MSKALYIILLVIFVNGSTQFLKATIDSIRDRKIDISLLFSSGGFPSTHAATMTSLAVVVGYLEGFDSVLFAITGVYAFFVMYDSFGVRLEAGKHGKFINKLIPSLNVKVKIDETVNFKYKELVGHTKLQVLGGFIYGLLVATVFITLFPFPNLI